MTKRYKATWKVDGVGFQLAKSADRDMTRNKHNQVN